jgi:hypothetical protein
LELRDFIVTPILIIIVYAVALLIRPRVTDEVNRRYFIPALSLKLFGALAVGFIYQFYYAGGDTYNYHTYGSRHLWNAFWDSPASGLKLFFYGPQNTIGVYEYASKIIFLTDPSSFAIVRLSFIFDLFTFSTYSATAVLFGVLGFTGIWMFFLTFYNQYPHLHRGLAIASFFIPSVVFWGSGVLKDTVSLACLGIAVNLTYRIFIQGRFSIINILFFWVALYVLYKVKVYIVLTFLPAAIVWIFLYNLSKMRSFFLKLLLFPIVTILAVALGYYSIVKAGQDSEKYSINNVAQTAQITAYDIRYFTGKDAGSGYSLGELDGTIGSMVKLAPQAINVSLFRPYLWEAKNPLMLLSALESFALLIGVIAIFLRTNIFALRALNQPNVIFLLVFSIAFAFAVGVSTFNFGTLVRYKIPMLPFFVVMLTLIYDHANRLKKLSELELTEY